MQLTLCELRGPPGGPRTSYWNKALPVPAMLAQPVGDDLQPIRQANGPLGVWDTQLPLFGLAIYLNLAANSPKSTDF